MTGGDDELDVEDLDDGEPIDAHGVDLDQGYDYFGATVGERPPRLPPNRPMQDHTYRRHRPALRPKVVSLQGHLACPYDGTMVPDMDAYRLHRDTVCTNRHYPDMRARAEDIRHMYLELAEAIDDHEGTSLAAQLDQVWPDQDPAQPAAVYRAAAVIGRWIRANVIGHPKGKDTQNGQNVGTESQSTTPQRKGKGTPTPPESSEGSTRESTRGAA